MQRGGVSPGARARLKPESLKATADTDLFAPLRICNLLKHADGVMSHAAVPPGGARIIIEPNTPDNLPKMSLLMPDLCTQARCDAKAAM